MRQIDEILQSFFSHGMLQRFFAKLFVPWDENLCTLFSVKLKKKVFFKFGGKTTIFRQIDGKMPICQKFRQFDGIFDLCKGFSPRDVAKVFCNSKLHI